MGDISELKFDDKNFNKHTPHGMSLLEKSLNQFGAGRSILVDKDNNIIAGNGIVEAAANAGITKTKVIETDGTELVVVKRKDVELNSNQGREMALADNATAAADLEWDDDTIGEFFDKEILDKWDVELDFTEAEKEIVEDEAPEPETETATKLGDIFILGNHKVMCGDSTKKDDMDKLMGGVLADLYLTDPPYNVDYTDGHKTERKIMNDHFDSDEECGEKLWLPSFENARANCNDCCSMYCFMPQGGTHMMMMMMRDAGWNVKHELIWEKQSVVLNRADYNYQHEPFMYGWNKTHRFYGKGEFKNTSVWKIDRPTKSKEHPTMKPVRLLAEILLNATQANDVVLDSFGGSGSTLIACEQLNRKCYTMELDPHYVDVIIKRWESLTGKKAIKQEDK
jgi:site-specific DNA-methyltransferase (adenine-specific)